MGDPCPEMDAHLERSTTVLSADYDSMVSEITNSATWEHEPKNAFHITCRFLMRLGAAAPLPERRKVLINGAKALGWMLAYNREAAEVMSESNPQTGRVSHRCQTHALSLCSGRCTISPSLAYQANKVVNERIQWIGLAPSQANLPFRFVQSSIQ